jgi:hypothetical protein
LRSDGVGGAAAYASLAIDWRRPAFDRPPAARIYRSVVLAGALSIDVWLSYAALPAVPSLPRWLHALAASAMTTTIIEDTSTALFIMTLVPLR